MSRALRALLASGLLGGCLAAAPAPAAAGTLALNPCQITHPLRLTVVAAECGVLEVAENPAAPGGRRIGLHVARVAAINRRKQADALFVLAGGPGQGAGDFYASVAPAFARIRRDRDIVLLDQRGTGASHALSCPGEEAQLYQASDAEVAAFAQRCLEGLRAQADPAFYTTSLAVADLERVRAALGYERIDLYGISYGTRVAQQYLRRFPTRVRALILDGVVPPQRALGPEVALDAESALRRILARCPARRPAARASAIRCATTRRCARRCEAQAVTVTVPDPASAAGRQVEVDRDHLATVLRLGAYSADYAALLPLFLRAGAHGRLRPARRAVPVPRALLREHRDRHAQQRRVHRGRTVLGPACDRPHGARGDLHGSHRGRCTREPVPHLAARADRCGLPPAAAQRRAGAAVVRRR